MDYDKRQDVELGLRLREIRESLHFTQSQFAEVFGIEVSQYKRIEKGISRITIDKVRTLYDKYSIDPDFLILGERGDKNDGDMEHIFANSSKESKKRFLSYILEYLIRAAD